MNNQSLIYKNPNLFKSKNIALQNRRVFLAPAEDISPAELEHDKNEITELMLMDYPKYNDKDSKGLLDDHKGNNLKSKMTPVNPIGMG